ncbi:HK97 gp10 family phage protein [Saccharopolyspora erythraea]|uniref:HK97 gp10 family phage protein n=1 Tax=Saccharopolyspora erythraea TaxID=1836 RepID=UPI001BA78C5F|nr:HK97 gp10 family phage protein [Saccharopolyspora erythraea]QUH01453.1 HK97 gp10 family phage protein [Saccharopolyspora erythraea]
MARYRPNHKGIAAYLRSSELADVTKAIAEDVARRAREKAPRSNNPEDGHYADGITVERDDSAGAKGDRVGFNVVATQGHPTLVEWGRKPGNGSPGYPGQHVMRDAAKEVTE